MTAREDLAKLPCFLRVGEAKLCQSICQPAQITGLFPCAMHNKLHKWLDPGRALIKLAGDLILVPAALLDRARQKCRGDEIERD